MGYPCIYHDDHSPQFPVCVCRRLYRPWTKQDRIIPLCIPERRLHAVYHRPANILRSQKRLLCSASGRRDRRCNVFYRLSADLQKTSGKANAGIKPLSMYIMSETGGIFMKKFLSLLAALTILLSFSACSEKNSREKEEAELDAVSSSMTGTLTSYTGS